MARSTYIYVVMRHSAPLAAFTVKHELASWVERNIEDLAAHGARVYRCRDGGGAVETVPLPRASTPG